LAFFWGGAFSLDTLYTFFLWIPGNLLGIPFFLSIRIFYIYLIKIKHMTSLIFTLYLISGALSRGTSFLHNLLNKKGGATLHGLIHSLSLLTIILMDPPSLWMPGILALLYLDVVIRLIIPFLQKVGIFPVSQRWLSIAYCFAYVISLFFIGVVQVGLIKLDAL
jgi:hypothetical protein